MPLPFGPLIILIPLVVLLFVAWLEGRKYRREQEEAKNPAASCRS